MRGPYRLRSAVREALELTVAAKSGSRRLRGDRSACLSSPTFTDLARCRVVSAALPTRCEGKRSLGLVRSAADSRRQSEALEVRRLKSGSGDFSFLARRE